jgi:hypothetical protein
MNFVGDNGVHYKLGTTLYHVPVLFDCVFFLVLEYVNSVQYKLRFTETLFTE